MLLPLMAVACSNSADCNPKEEPMRLERQTRVSTPSVDWRDDSPLGKGVPWNEELTAFGQASLDEYARRATFELQADPFLQAVVVFKAAGPPLPIGEWSTVRIHDRQATIVRSLGPIVRSKSDYLAKKGQFKRRFRAITQKEIRVLRNLVKSTTTLTDIPSAVSDGLPCEVAVVTRRGVARGACNFSGTLESRKSEKTYLVVKEMLTLGSDRTD